MKVFLIASFLFALTSICKAQYVPAPFDYVLPQQWSFSPIDNITWSAPTGLPNPYATNFSIVNKRCRVQSMPFTLNGTAQLYVNLTIVGTSYTIMWPVNYVSPFGQVQDFLIKTI